MDSVDCAGPPEVMDTIWSNTMSMSFMTSTMLVVMEGMMSGNVM